MSKRLVKEQPLLLKVSVKALFEKSIINKDS
jgi:hypothetical protein